MDSGSCYPPDYFSCANGKLTFKQATDYRGQEDAIHVKVVGHQFWWEFEYPELGIVTAQDMVIPVGKYIAVEMISQDVNHSFWIPALAGKIDVNPGAEGANANLYYIKADEAMVYKGKCAEFCGDAHTLMDFKVNAVSEAEFNTWVNKMKTPLAAVPESVKKGEQIFNNSCLSCHAISTDGRSYGPNLNGFASRTTIAGYLEHNDEVLADWVKDPVKYKPGVKMPAVGLNDADIAEVVKYMNTLK